MPASVDPVQLAEAEGFWRRFVLAAKVFVAVVAVILLLLALVTV